ncbi:MAG: beta-hydroxylase [Methylophaga sp.]|nr:MAG: beta-hydroxylase [Methylophaga sp.]
MVSHNAAAANTETKVRVSAPARLHLGFLDLNGGAGRKFGSIGLAINSHQVIIEIQLANKTSVAGVNTSPSMVDRIHGLLEKFYSSLGKLIPAEHRAVSVTLIDVIPSHAGLGSGTQLALALGTALCRLHNITTTTHDIAQQLSRGARSGIGIATFDHGGFIVDGGLSENSTIPPLLVHCKPPQSWRIVLIMDQNSQGIHGEQELLAFTDLPAFPIADSHAICHHVLMQLLPAITEQEIIPFGQAITEIQSLIGDHFAPAQGGRYASQQVASLLEYAQKLGHTGIAQSSWGPTACIFVESDEAAQKLVSQLSKHIKQQTPDHHGLSLIITQANENGADIVV